jgi:hypothetical protein
MKVLSHREKHGYIPSSAPRAVSYRPYVHRDSLREYIPRYATEAVKDDLSLEGGACALRMDASSGDDENNKSAGNVAVPVDHQLEHTEDISALYTKSITSSFPTRRPPEKSGNIVVNQPTGHSQDSSVILDQLHSQEEALREQTVAVQHMLAKLDSTFLLPRRSKHGRHGKETVEKIAEATPNYPHSAKNSSAQIGAYSYYLQQSDMVTKLLHAPASATRSINTTNSLSDAEKRSCDARYLAKYGQLYCKSENDLGDSSSRLRLLPVDEQLSRFSVSYENLKEKRSAKWKATENILLSMHHDVTERSRKDSSRQISDHFLLKRKGWAVLRKLFLGAKMAQASRTILHIFLLQSKKSYLKLWKHWVNQILRVKRCARFLLTRHYWKALKKGVRCQKCIMYSTRRATQYRLEFIWNVMARSFVKMWSARTLSSIRCNTISVIHHYHVVAKLFLSRLKNVVHVALVNRVTRTLAYSRNVRSAIVELRQKAIFQQKVRLQQMVLQRCALKNRVNRALDRWLLNSSIPRRRFKLKLKGYLQKILAQQVRCAIRLLYTSLSRKRMMQAFEWQYCLRICCRHFHLWEQLTKRLQSVGCDRKRRRRRLLVSAESRSQFLKNHFYRRWQVIVEERSYQKSLSSSIATQLLHLSSNSKKLRGFMVRLRCSCHRRFKCTDNYVSGLLKRRRSFIDKLQQKLWREDIHLKITHQLQKSKGTVACRAVLKNFRKLFEYRTMTLRSGFFRMRQMLSRAFHRLDLCARVCLSQKLHMAVLVHARNNMHTSLLRLRKLKEFHQKRRDSSDLFTKTHVHYIARATLAKIFPAYVIRQQNCRLGDRLANEKFQLKSKSRLIKKLRALLTAAKMTGRTKLQLTAKSDHYRAQKLVCQGYSRLLSWPSRRSGKQLPTANSHYRDRACARYIRTWRTVVCKAPSSAHVFVASTKSVVVAFNKATKTGFKLMGATILNDEKRFHSRHTRLISFSAFAYNYKLLRCALQYWLKFQDDIDGLENKRRTARRHLKQKYWRRFRSKVSLESGRRGQQTALKKAKKYAEYAIASLSRLMLARLHWAACIYKMKWYAAAAMGDGFLVRRAMFTWMGAVGAGIRVKYQFAQKFHRRRLQRRVLNKLMDDTHEAAAVHARCKLADTSLRGIRLKRILWCWIHWVQERCLNQRTANETAGRHYKSSRLHHSICWWMQVCENAHILRSHRKVQRIPISAARLHCFFRRWRHEAASSRDCRAEKNDVDVYSAQRCLLRGLSFLSEAVLTKIRLNALVSSCNNRIYKLRTQRGLDFIHDYCAGRRLRKWDTRRYKRALYLCRQGLQAWIQQAARTLNLTRKIQFGHHHHSLRCKSTYFGTWQGQHSKRRDMNRTFRKGGSYLRFSSLIMSFSWWRRRCQHTWHSKKEMNSARLAQLRKGWTLFALRHRIIGSVRSSMKSMLASASSHRNKYLLKLAFGALVQYVSSVLKSLTLASTALPVIKTGLILRKLARNLVMKKRKIVNTNVMINWNARKHVRKLFTFLHDVRDRTMNLVKAQSRRKLRLYRVGLNSWHLFAYNRSAVNQKLLAARAILYEVHSAVDWGFSTLASYAQQQQLLERKFLTCLWKLESLVIRRLIHTWQRQVETQRTSSKSACQADEYFRFYVQRSGLKVFRRRCRFSATMGRSLVHYFKRMLVRSINSWRFHIGATSAKDRSTFFVEGAQASGSKRDYRPAAQIRLLKMSQMHRRWLVLNSACTRWRERAACKSRQQQLVLKFIFWTWTLKMAAAFKFLRKLLRLRNGRRHLISLLSRNRFMLWRRKHSVRNRHRHCFVSLLSSWVHRQVRHAFQGWARWTRVISGARELQQLVYRERMNNAFYRWDSRKHMLISSRTSIRKARDLKNNFAKRCYLRRWMFQVSNSRTCQRRKDDNRGSTHWKEFICREILFTLRFMRKVRLVKHRVALCKSRVLIKLLRAYILKNSSGRQLVHKAQKLWMQKWFCRLRSYCLLQRHIHRAIDYASLRARDRIEHLRAWNVQLRASQYLNYYRQRLHILQSERRLVCEAAYKRSARKQRVAFKFLLTNRSFRRRIKKSLENIGDCALFDSFRKYFHKWDRQTANKWSTVQRIRLVEEHYRHSCLVRGWRALINGRKRLEIIKLNFP